MYVPEHIVSTDEFLNLDLSIKKLAIFALW